MLNDKLVAHHCLAFWLVATLSSSGLLVGQTLVPEARPTPLDPTLFAAAVVTVLSSLGGMIVLIINAASAAKDRREAAQERRELRERADATGQKADTLIESTARIHELTNSTNSNLQKSLELMIEKHAGLERVIAQMQEATKATAAARQTTDMQAAFLAQPPVHAAPAPADAAAPDASAKTTLAVDESHVQKPMSERSRPNRRRVRLHEH